MSNLQLALPGLLAESAVEWVWGDDFDEVSDVKRFEHTTVMRDEVVRARSRREPAASTWTSRWAAAATRSRSSRPSRRRGSSGSIGTRWPSRPRGERLGPVRDRVSLVAATFSRIRDELDVLGIERVDGS